MASMHMDGFGKNGAPLFEPVDENSRSGQAGHLRPTPRGFP